MAELLDGCRPAASSGAGSQTAKPYPCPCCGNYTMEEEPVGSYQTCPVCAWVDDPWALEHPDEPGGCNLVTLAEGRENYRACGACSPELHEHTRPPTPEEELGISEEVST
nr:CPCC family cysteine-rich protein [uncultured Flavonifractor sp.]